MPESTEGISDAVKAYLVDAALLEAYNTLEIKGKKRTAAMQRMLEIKAESPKLDTVQYYWLDDLVERIEFKQDTMGERKVGDIGKVLVI